MSTRVLDNDDSINPTNNTNNINHTNISDKLNKLTLLVESKEKQSLALDKDIATRENILKLQQENLPKEYKRYEDEIKLRDKQIEALKAALSETSQNKEYLDDLKKKIIDKELKLNEANETIDRLNNQLDELKLSEEENNVKFTEEVLRLNTKNENLQELVNNLKTEIDLRNNKDKNDAELETLKEIYNEEKSNADKLRKEKEELESKLTNMKNTLQEIKDKFEVELAKKLHETNETNAFNTEEFNNKIKSLEESIKTLKKIISGLNKEKLEFEEIILKQEEKVNELSNKFSTIDRLVKAKNKELKENETHMMKLVSIIEEQKKMIIDNKSDYEDRLVVLENLVEDLKREVQVKDTKISSLMSRIKPKNLPYNAQTNSQLNGINNGKSPTPIKKLKSKKDAELPPIRNERVENDKKLDEITNMMNRLLEEN